MALGFPLFPCCNKSKKPLTVHGFKDVTLDETSIVQWCEAHPGCAWGVPTSSNRAVIDIDPRNGGDAAWSRLLADRKAIPYTPITLTGGGGEHVWVELPAGTRCGKLAEGIDVKAEGGYVIVPPSQVDIPEHQGRRYIWQVAPWDTPLATAPEWVSRLLEANRHGHREKGKADAVPRDPWIVQPACQDDLTTHPGCRLGDRRNTFCRLAGVHIARCDSVASIRAMAEAWAMRCDPPFDGQPDPGDDWRKHLAGLFRREAGQPPSPLAALAVPPSPGTVIGKELFPPVPSGENNSFPETVPERFTANGEGKRAVVTDPPSWPTLHPDASHGLLGEMLQAIAPETEADPSGILVTWLTLLGNAIGRGAWVKVGADTHYPALYTAIVGRTSDAKGVSWGVGLYPFRQADPFWASRCIAHGVGSGEGLVERVRDEAVTVDGRRIPAAEDKRCLVRLGELSRCFKAGRREGSTLSEYMREAWDGHPIHIPNRSGNALSASGYTVGLVGDITPDVLRKLIASGTEAFDGWANRFLWIAVRSPRDLPSGGNVHPLDPFMDRLKAVMAFGQRAGEMRRTPEAEALWESVYPRLKASGDTVPHTDRGRPLVVRLAMLYAIADGVTAIGEAHLRAALAVWEYARASAAFIFGSQPEAEPDPLWLRLLNAITDAPGVSRSDLLRAVRKPSGEVAEALGLLAGRGLAFSVKARSGHRGPEGEHWYPGNGEGEEGVSRGASKPASHGRFKTSHEPGE